MKLGSIAACVSMLALPGCAEKQPAQRDTAAGATASVATSPAPEPTAVDISNYKLDMDAMRKYATAIKGFAVLAKTDSAAAEAMASNSNKSTAAMIAKLEASPAAMKVLNDAGLSAKDYVWITAAWIQAAMTETMLEAKPDAKLPPGQNPQNIEFLKAHKAELDSMTKEMGNGR